jgi:hypothetical protein
MPWTIADASATSAMTSAFRQMKMVFAKPTTLMMGGILTGMFAQLACSLLPSRQIAGT